MCIHVGDYIYEYYNPEAPPQVEPRKVLRTLADYCTRYASARSDPDLQELHRLRPWIVIFDDHEIVDDSWTGGADKHNPAIQGPWTARKAAALAAWDCWLPVRPRQDGLLRRAFRWSDTADLICIDTRMEHRDRELLWEESGLTANMPEADFNARLRAFEAVIRDPSRQMIGSAQEQWLDRQMRRSIARGARWQVVAQGSVVSRRLSPAGTVDMLPDDASAAVRERRALNVRLAAYDWP